MSLPKELHPDTEMVKKTAQERSQGSARSGRGQSLVEFSLVLPVLLMLLLGGIDLGRVFYYEVIITSAAREGVRAASTDTAADADVQAAVQNEVASAFALDSGLIVVNPSPARVPGSPVTVTVSYDFRALTPVVDGLLGNQPLRIAGWATAVVQ